VVKNNNIQAMVKADDGDDDEETDETPVLGSFASI